jgi:hypothetical protein
VTFAIADDDESVEAHMLAAHLDTADLVDINNAVLVFIFVAAEATAASATLTRTAFVVAEFAIARTASRFRAMGLIDRIAIRTIVAGWSLRGSGSGSAFRGFDHFLFFFHKFSP